MQSVAPYSWGSKKNAKYQEDRNIIGRLGRAAFAPSQPVIKPANLFWHLEWVGGAVPPAPAQ